MKPTYKKNIYLLNSNSKKSVNKNDAKTGDRFLKTLVTTISLAGIALTLIGYGVTLHRAARFGLDVTDIGRSPMDFLVNSTDFVVVVVGSFKEIIALAIFEPEIIFVGVGVGICFVVFYAIYRGFLSSPKRFHASRLRIRNTSSVVGQFVREKHLNYALVAGVGTVTPTAFTLLGALLICTVFTLIAILPAIGFLSEENLVKKYIIDPPRCTALWNSKKVKKSRVDNVPSAICVRAIDKEGNEIARGRRIAVSGDRLFLFKKAEGKVLSIPIRDALVEQVESE